MTESGSILTVPVEFIKSAFVGSVNIKKTIYISIIPEPNKRLNCVTAFFVGLIMSMPIS